jgi:hypothetical protein
LNPLNDPAAIRRRSASQTKRCPLAGRFLFDW